ncbi:MAG: AAA family ATPase [Candidatus Sericytochromatia bacterium]
MEVNPQESMEVTERQITDNLEELLVHLPPAIASALRADERLHELIEVILDLGREPEARYANGYKYLSEQLVTQADIEHVVSTIGDFGDDNRAGIERTLHRISCMRNRKGKIIGLTCRVGRAVQGTIDIIRDLVESGRSILAMGRPGVGKTTKLREIARILSDDLHKRVVVIDTSNEIAGDGDIPHPAIGRARRMQVRTSAEQHAVMIEAVENHMPEVIVIDEISTKAEADAARTIAERGVQLIGTAHGNSIENLILNPSLNDLVGGIESVTLGDEEAKRRGTQKTVLERKAPPTFDVAIEIQDRYQMAIHLDVAEVVDQYLRGKMPGPEIRFIDADGKVKKIKEQSGDTMRNHMVNVTGEQESIMHIYPYAVSRSQVERVIKTMRLPAKVTKNMDEADALMLLQSYKKHRKIIDAAEARQIPVYMVRSNTIYQIQKSLRQLMQLDAPSPEEEEMFREMDDPNYLDTQAYPDF